MDEQPESTLDTNQENLMEDHKDMVWSGESDLLEEWNFVVHTNKLNSNDETASDGESVEILSREKIGDPALVTDDTSCENESQDCERADSDNESNAAEEEEDEAAKDDEECYCATADDDATEESSPQIVPVGVFPEENLIPVHPMDTAVETIPSRSDLELPLESRKIIVLAGLVLFIGWFLLIFHVRSEENIDKIKLDNDVKWQTMNEKYSNLMQELAIYKEKSQLMDLSLNDLKALQVDGKAVSCQFDDKKWQQMHEKYLQLERDLASFKRKSKVMEDVDNIVKNRMKHHDSGSSFSSGTSGKTNCGEGKSSYCDKNGHDVPHHSEILRLIKQLDSRPELEKSPHASINEPEFIDLKGKFFNMKRAFETSDVKSFEEDFEKLYEILSRDKDDYIGADLNLIVKYNTELYESFLALMDESERLTKYLNKTDPRSAEELTDLARISYEYVLSNLQKSNYNVAKLVNDYEDFAKAVAIDIGYSSRRYGQKRLKKDKDWKSKNDGSKDNFNDDFKRKSRSHSREKDESSLIPKCLDEVFGHYHRVSVLNEEIRKLLKEIPQSGRDANSYVRIVCQRINTNLNDANIVLSRFMDSFGNMVKQVKFSEGVKKHHKKDTKEKEDFKPTRKMATEDVLQAETKAHRKYEKKADERRGSRESRDSGESSESSESYNDYDDRRENLKHSHDDGNVFKYLKSTINNYHKIISDKAANFNKKLKNHTMRVKEKFQKKMKSVLDFEKAKKLNEKIMHHGSKIKNKLTQKFDSLWDSVSKKLKNATEMAVASSEWLFDFNEDGEKQDSDQSKEEVSVDLNNNNWMLKRAEFRNAKREDTAYWYFRRGNARRRSVEKYKKL